MKKALYLAAAFISMQAHAQTPYFLQEHSGNNILYGAPVDMEFDLDSTFYSLHFVNQGPGALITQYDAISGAVLNVSNLLRGNATIKPTRIRTLGTNYYVLFNGVSGAGVSYYCLVSISAITNTVNWSRAFSPPTGAASRNAVDFILDGGSFAYILCNAYDAVNNQNDLAITAVDITTPAFSWDNVYQNTTRSESASNIVYRATTSELIVSAISVDPLNPVIDRGPMLMRVGTAGNYVASMLYEYTPGCTHAEPSGAWVGLGTNNFYLSSTSYENGVNGPLWISKINPTSMAITIQTNHQTNSAYLSPEFQFVLVGIVPHVLFSGSMPLGPFGGGYVHTEFTTSALAFAQGVIYPSTNPQSYGSPMFDAYNVTGPGLNIFSVAENAALPNNYYLMKTSDVGRNDCDNPFVVTPDNCQMSPIGISFTRIPVAVITAPVVCSISPRSNSITQPCLVPLMQAPITSRESLSTPGTDLVVSPNPTRDIFTLSAGKSILSGVHVFNPDGKAVPAEVNETLEGMRVNLTGRKAGIYVVQVLVDGEPKAVRVVLE